MREEYKEIQEPYEKPEILTEEIEIGVYGQYAFPTVTSVSCTIEG